jgi:hypothetical protein
MMSAGCMGTLCPTPDPFDKAAAMTPDPLPPTLTLLGTGETVPLAGLSAGELAGAVVYLSPDGRVLAPAFRGTAVDLGAEPLPGPEDEDALAELVLRWVSAVRTHDWSDVRGQQLEAEGDWIDLRTAMVRVGWGPVAAQAAWQACRERPYARELPTAAGWAAAGWVVPAVAGEPEPTFATPVLEARGLHRWAYIARWQEPVAMPGGDPPTQPEPRDLGWADVLSRLRQDHYTAEALAEATDLAVELLTGAGLGPASPIEAEDDPLPPRHTDAALQHPSPLVRATAWFLLRDLDDAWLACGYSECQHHWAVEAEEDAYELDEVLELAGHGLANPLDAAMVRRRLLTMAFGDVRDVPLAGQGDLDAFVAFYTEWVAHGRPEEALEEVAAELRGDD